MRTPLVVGVIRYWTRTPLGWSYVIRVDYLLRERVMDGCAVILVLAHPSHNFQISLYKTKMVAFIEYNDDEMADEVRSVASDESLAGTVDGAVPMDRLWGILHPHEQEPVSDAVRNREIADINAINELKMGFANSDRVPTILSEYVLHCLDCWDNIGALRYFFDMFNELEFSVSQQKFDCALRAFTILKNAYDGEFDNDPRFVMVGDGMRPALWIDSMI